MTVLNIASFYINFISFILFVSFFLHITHFLSGSARVTWEELYKFIWSD